MPRSADDRIARSPRPLAGSTPAPSDRHDRPAARTRPAASLRYLEAEIARLHAGSATTVDDVSRVALQRASIARAQQLSVYGELVTRRDRVVAQLELVYASLCAVTATIVKLQAADIEQHTGIEEPVAAYLGDIKDHLMAVEAALAPELAA